MKLFSLLLIFSCSQLFIYGQAIEEYAKLEPVINRNGENEQEKNIVFFEPGGIIRQEELLAYNTGTKREKTFNNSGSTLKPDQILEAFYDPYSRKSYVYVETEPERGWYSVTFDKEHSSLKTDVFIGSSVFQSRRCPPVVDTTEYKLFADYSYDKNAKEYQESFRIIKKDSGNVVWDMISRIPAADFIQYKTSFHNVYWIDNGWLLIEDTPITGGSSGVTQKLYNFITKEERSFAPEVVIGYGKGQIITTSKELIGITIQDPDGVILFKDEKLELTGMLKGTLQRGLVSFAYFENPYVYYTVYTGSAGRFPYCTVMLNLSTLKTYRTSGKRWDLIGVFSD